MYFVKQRGLGRACPAHGIIVMYARMKCGGARTERSTYRHREAYHIENREGPDRSTELNEWSLWRDFTLGERLVLNPVART